ncbi:MAG: oligopeptide/dipeptide ABC transporter ATP-binding protein [Elioraea tepidiphila]
MPGSIPSPFDLPAGCRFCNRCPKVIDKCHTEEPTLREVAPGRASRCLRAEEVT